MPQEPPPDASPEQLKYWTCPNQAVVLKMAGDLGSLVKGQSRLEGHAERTNGIVGEIVKEQQEMNGKQLRMDGAIAAWRWIFATALTVGGVVTAVMGVVVAILARGG